MYCSSIKINQNYGIMVFVKHYLCIEFFEYDFLDANILKLYISNTKVPINLICVYRSLTSNSYIFMNSISKVIDGFKWNSAITGFHWWSEY